MVPMKYVDSVLCGLSSVTVTLFKETNYIFNAKFLQCFSLIILSNPTVLWKIENAKIKTNQTNKLDEICMHLLFTAKYLQYIFNRIMTH